MMFRLAYPALLALLCLVAGWVAWQVKRRPATVTYSMTAQLSRLARGSGLAGRIPLMARTLCLILLVLALARPQLFNVSREIQSSGVDIMLCLDTSGSMRALDFSLDGKPVSRSAAVKKVVRDFIQKRENDRIGLVVFGTEAFTQSPLTLDKGLLMELIKRMKNGMAGEKTAIGSAIAVGAKRLRDLKAKTKLLILLTDGRQTAGELTPEAAAEAAKALGIKIYTIGIGGTEPAPFPIQTAFGTQIIRQPVDLDEATLTRVAAIGQGKYFRAADTQQLQEIYDIIDRQEKTTVKVKEFFHFKELYPYLLVPAFILLMAEIVMRATILRTIP